MSYKILSPHYVGMPSVSSAPKVNAKDIKSNQGMAIDRKSTAGGQPTHGSYGNAAPTLIFAKEGVITRSSATSFRASYRDFYRNGQITQIDDYRFGRWKKAATENPPNREWNKPIPKNPDFAVIQSPRLGMYFPDRGDTPVNLQTSHDIVNAFDPNKLGYALSKISNLENTLRGMVAPGSEHYAEAAESIKFIAGKGFKIDKSDIIGLGVEKGDFLAAYYPSGYLVAETKFNDRAKKLISKYGLSEREAVEAMKRIVLLHECWHAAGVKSEKLQGLLEAEFSTMMADKHKGTKMEKIYRALARQGMDYAKEHSLANKILDITSEDDSGRAVFGEYKRKFIREAIALGEKDVSSYVSMRMEETFGALKGEPSYKAARAKSKHSKLEEIANEYGMEEAEYKSVSKPEYKSMSDAKRSLKSAKEAPQEAGINAETAEATASGE